MGNARWKGARLKDILARAGLNKDAVEIAFNGSDRAPLAGTPAFVKSLPAWKAMDENTLVAYEMNGAALPHWNGFPARIVVPGWSATYWMKQVASIRALSQPLASYWMNTAYRIPIGKFPIIDRFTSQESATTTPITEILVNSLITNLSAGQRFAAGRALECKGESLGKYSFRTWQFTCPPRAAGRLSVMARASNTQGTVQPAELIFNAPGYHNNVVQKIALDIV
jgi:hypothetical protein